MVFVGQETQFGKIGKNSIIFVTPLLFMKKLCDPQIFHDPLYSEEYDSPVKLVPYKDPGCVWILGIIGYFLPVWSTAIMYWYCDQHTPQKTQ